MIFVAVADALFMIICITCGIIYDKKYKIERKIKM